MKVVEVFYSIDGEGRRTGAPAIFIRFAGCNLRCDYCDTSYALAASQADDAYPDAESVVNKILSFCKSADRLTLYNLTFTGGEPLLHDDDIIEILKLLNEKSDYRYSINIETNGSIDPNPFLEKYLDLERESLNLHEMFFTFDIKTASAGEAAKAACFKDSKLVATVSSRLQLMRHIGKMSAPADADVMKAVVGSVEDLDYVRQVYLDLGDKHNDYSWYVSPVFGKIEPKTLVEYVLAHPELNDWKVQVQLHKIIWPPQMRGV